MASISSYWLKPQTGYNALAATIGAGTSQNPAGVGYGNSQAFNSSLMKPVQPVNPITNAKTYNKTDQNKGTDPGSSASDHPTDSYQTGSASNTGNDVVTVSGSNNGVTPVDQSKIGFGTDVTGDATNTVDTTSKAWTTKDVSYGPSDIVGQFTSADGKVGLLTSSGYLINPSTGQAYATMQNNGTLVDISGNVIGKVFPDGSYTTWANNKTTTGTFSDYNAKPDAPIDIPQVGPSSDSTSGLPPELVKALTDLIDKMKPSVDQYAKFMSGLSDPTKFVETSRQPMQTAVTQATQDLAHRGLTDSTDLNRMVGEIPNALNELWMKNQLGISDAMAKAAGLPFSAFGNLQQSTSHSEDPNDWVKYLVDILAMK